MHPNKNKSAIKRIAKGLFIFKRFYRGQGSIGKDGIGFGLYLSRKIITDQGGYIKVRSSQNGSTFSVFFPLSKKIA